MNKHKALIPYHIELQGAAAIPVFMYYLYDFSGTFKNKNRCCSSFAHKAFHILGARLP